MKKSCFSYLFGATMLSIFFLVIAASCDRADRLEDDAVIVDIRISPDHAKKGGIKTVRAPDRRVFNLVISPGIKNLTPLKLPPKVAATYQYPLYFRVNIMAPGESPEDDLLNRKRKH